jgi:hypothetical protein
MVSKSGQTDQTSQHDPVAGWNPTTDEDYNRLRGQPVFSADGREVGTLCAVFHPPEDEPVERGSHFFLVEATPVEPRFRGEELYLSEQLLQRVEPDRVVLAVPLDQLQGDLIRKPINLIGWNRK